MKSGDVDEMKNHVELIESKSGQLAELEKTKISLKTQPITLKIGVEENECMALTPPQGAPIRHNDKHFSSKKNI